MDGLIDVLHAKNGRRWTVEFFPVGGRSLRNVGEDGRRVESAGTVERMATYLTGRPRPKLYLQIANFPFPYESGRERSGPISSILL
jgi:hypothetical protein